MKKEPQHILIVEDEAHLAIGIKFNLEAEGYRVTAVGNGPDALQVIEANDHPVEMVVLDLMLPGMSGYEVCQRLRESGENMPVLILSARTLTEDRTRSFDVGANQYLTKPFELDELISRVKNLLSNSNRISAGHRDSDSHPLVEYEFANAKVNFDTYQIIVRGKPARLTQLQIKVLRYFIENEGSVIPRTKLLEDVWGMPGTINTRAPDQIIRQLRKTFEPDPGNPVHFQTIRDAGYRFISGRP